MMDAKDVIWSAAQVRTGTTLPSLPVTLSSLMTANEEETTSLDPITTSTSGLSAVEGSGNGGQGSGEYSLEEDITSNDFIPKSVCSYPCKLGQIMIMNTVRLFLT